MDYTLQFGQIERFFPSFLVGALISLALAATSFSGGLLIGLVGAAVKTYGSGFARRLTDAYVIFFTNTPQLVQIFFLFFVLPDAGILLSPYNAVLIGMTLNAGAYLTEIQRAGFLSVRRQEIEAAETIGMSRIQTIRYVVMPHVIRTLFPPLSSHYISMVLGTSMAAVFGVNELTGRAMSANAETFRAVEIYLVVGAIYIAITFVASALLMLAGRRLLGVRMGA
ncbi:MAG: amino acid ABC transporter permease [Variovorax sp.]